MTELAVVIVPNAVAVQGIGSQGDPGTPGDPGPEGEVGPVGPGYLASSFSSRTIAAPASITFITQTGLAYTPGMRARAAASISPTNWMEGQVTGYSDASLTIAMDLVNGAGTFSSWNINLSGERGGDGPQGIPGELGLQGIQGIPGNDGTNGTNGTNGAGYGGTSTTSLLIQSTVMAFTTQAGLAYVVGSRIRLASAIGPSNFMEGTVTAYSGTSMTVSVTNTGGSGTFSNWNLSIAGTNGIDGVGYGGTSATSVVIGTGGKTFTTQAGMAYAIGQRVRAASASNGLNFMEGQVTGYSGTGLTINVDLVGGSGTFADWVFGVAGTQGATGAAGSGIGGSCVLALSGGNLVLQAKNGNQLLINGTYRTVSGQTLAPTGLTASTNYYIYASWNGSAIVLEASTTGHVTDGTLGIEVKSGDATRTLVGLVRVVTGPAFSDTATNRFVRSWFNRGSAQCRNAFTATRTTTTSSAEINSEIRCNFVCWADDMCDFTASSYGFNSAAAFSFVGISYDGAAVTLNNLGVSFGPDPGSQMVSTEQKALSEGFHYATFFGGVSGGTGTFGDVSTAYGIVFGVIR